MLLEDFFVAAPPGGIDGRPFLAVEGRPLAAKCWEGLASLPTGGYLAVALRLDAPGRLRHLADLLTLPVRVAGAASVLARCGAVPVGRYGVSPDLGSPTVVYPLNGPASRYAERHLLPGGRRRWPFVILRKVLSWWTGCDVSLGGVLVIGRKP